MLNTQIPYFKEKGFSSALGYTWFWLGYEYRHIGQYEKTIEAFGETLKIMPPENEYFANAKSAIYCETKVLKASKRDDFKKIDINTTGEKYRFIDGKLYFWSQPGYGCAEETAASSIFWNLSACNNLMFDPEMKVGDVIVSDSGKGKLAFISNTEVCNTPAGIFENCFVFEFQGDRYGLTCCRTFICAGVGIVRQEVERFGMRRVLELSQFNIVGGEGVIPFAPGNRWDYSTSTPNTAVLYDEETFFEVTAFENNMATVAAVVCCETLGYFDTFDGKIEEVKRTYYTGHDNNVKLVDVRGLLQRAKELALTKRQKTRMQVVEDVMLRIINTDPDITPEYTEKGRWNFYSCGTLTNINGKIQWLQTEHFEWKDLVNLGIEGRKMLYSFFDDIVDSCGMGWWSDEWVPGFTAKPKKPLKEFTVLEDETVITPAGTFENCRHISFDLDFDFYFGGQSECWYAEGIGFVRFAHRIDENTKAVWPLTEYQGVGEGYFPIADGLYRKYKPEHIEDGYSAGLEYSFDSDENGICVFRNATGNQNRANYEKLITK